MVFAAVVAFFDGYWRRCLCWFDASGSNPRDTVGHIFGWQRRNLRNDIARYIRQFPVAVNGYVPSGHWRSRQPRICNARTVRTRLWGGDIIIFAFASTASFCRGTVDYGNAVWVFAGFADNPLALASNGQQCA